MKADGMNPLRRLAALTPLCCAFATLAAHAADPPATVELSSMTVAEQVEGDYVEGAASTATKSDLDVLDVPQSIEVRTRQLLDDLGGTQNSYDVARTVAGAFSAENGQGDPGRNVPNFIFRGFNNNGSYLKDGHLINGWMSTTDMASVERVEFLKGPASFLYGGSIYTGDIGGVVNYVSKLPTATPMASADLALGSDAFQRATVDLGGALARGGELTGRLNAAVERGNSFRDFATHGSQFLAPALTFAPSSQDSLTLLTEFGRSHEIPARGLPLSPDSLGIDPSRNFIDPDFARTDIGSYNLAGRYAHQLGNGWALALDATQTYSHTDQFANYIYYNPGDTSTLEGSHWRLHNDQLDLDARITGTWTSGGLQHQLLFGANVVNNLYDAWSEFGWGSLSIPLAGNTLAELVLPPPGSMNTLYAATPADPGSFHWDNHALAAYAQDLVSFGGHFKLLASARYDKFRNDTSFDGSFGASDQVTRNSHVSPRVGLMYQPTTSTSIYVVWAQAFSPNSGITLSGAAPPPETGVLQELGVKWNPLEDLEVHAAAYELTRKNMAFTDPNDPNEIAVLVAGQTRSHGIELDVNGRLTESLRVNIAATTMRGWISQGEPGGSLAVGTDFPGVPQRTLNIWGVYSFDAARTWEVGGGLYQASSAWADAANTFRVPAIVQWDALLSWRPQPHTQLQLDFKNIANHDNYTSNGWGWINPSDPFSFYATLRHDF